MDAELLVLQDENAVLRGQLTGAVRAVGPDLVRRAVRVVPATPVGAGVPGHARAPARLTPQDSSWSWDYSKRRWRSGRPPTADAVKALVLPLARESPRWGCRGIRGELACLQHPIGTVTVQEILTAAGIQSHTAAGRHGARS